METSLFIPALSKTLPESCLQGLVVYLALQLLFALFKKSTPLLCFNLYYAATVFLFLGFLFSFFNHYLEAKDTVFNGTFLTNTSVVSKVAIVSKPQVWLQISYWTSHYAYTISGLYLIGLIFCVLRLMLGLINISWFKSSKYLQFEDQLSAQVRTLVSNFNLLKTVSVFLSDKIQVPLTIGFLKPIIVFPIALVNQLSAEQTEAILLHELAHIKRNDYLLNVIISLIQSFLFFNPLIWLMGREINKYREQCCDDLVLDKTQHQLAYARALLLIEENRSAQLMLALASNGKKYTLLNRIKRITNMKTNEPSPQNKLIILLLTITTIGISVAWNFPSKKTLKHFTVHNFKVIKEASDSTHVEQFSNKTIDYPAHKSAKKSKPANRKFTVNSFTDTVIKSKNRFKIVLEDSIGNKKEYNSVEELPADAQKEFLKQNQKIGSLMNYNFNSVPMTNFKMLDRLNDTVFFSSPQWKKQAEEMRKQGLEMRKQFNSPEWKKQIEKMSAQGEEMQKYFNSPEWKKQQEEINKAANEATSKYFNSPEWKKQMDDIKKQGGKINKQFNSRKWKKQMELIRKNSTKYNIPTPPVPPETPEKPEKPDQPEKL